MSEDEKTMGKGQSEGATPVTVAGKVADGMMVKLFGPIAEEMGRDLAQWYRTKRKTNLDKILPQAAQKAEAAGAERVEPPMSVVIPMIEKASLEDNAFMQEKWASLLSASVSPAMAGKVRKGFPQILSELEPLEAKMLDVMYDEFKRKSPDAQLSTYYFSVANMIQYFHTDKRMMSISLRNLLRLGLCENPISGIGVGSEGTESPKEHLLTGAENYICLSELGVDFVECCRS